MGVVLVPRIIESLSVPRCEVVPFLIAGTGDVVGTCSGCLSAATETYAAAISLVCAGGVVTVVALLVVVVVVAAAGGGGSGGGQTVETRHRLLCGAIVVQL